MEEKQKHCRTPRKNPTPRKLVRVNLEPPQQQSTGLSISTSDIGCRLNHKGASTSVCPFPSCSGTTETQSAEGVSADVKTESLLDKDVVSVNAMLKNSKRSRASGSYKRKQSHRLLEPLPKRRKCHSADVSFDNESLKHKKGKSNKQASKSQVDKKLKMNKDSDFQLQLQQKPQGTEDPEGQRISSVEGAATSKRHSHDTKTDQLGSQNRETSAVLDFNSVSQCNSTLVSRNSSSERGNICKRLFDVACDTQVKDRTVSNSMLPQILKNTMSEINGDNAVMDLSIRSPNFRHTDLAFSLSSTSVAGTLVSASTTELGSVLMNESCDVLDLSTAETDRFSEPVSKESSFLEKAHDANVSESELRTSVEHEDSQLTEEFNSSAAEHFVSKTSKSTKSLPPLSDSPLCTSSVTKEASVDLKITAHLSPSDCAVGADLKEDMDKSEPNHFQVESESRTNVSDVQCTPTATDGIQQLADELNILNQQSSYVATHMYRRQTPRRKRTFGIRQLSSGMPSENASASTTPAWRFSRRTPSKSSPRVTPRRPGRSALSPRMAKLVFGSPVTRGGICSPLKLRTPSKPTAKRKLYSDSPELRTEKQKPASSTTKFQDFTEKTPAAAQLEVDPKPDETVRSVSDAQHSPTDVPSTPDQLKIVEDGNDDDVPVFDFEIDNILEEKSKKFVHLTAKNVRSIIHQVLTNDDVKNLMRTALQEGSLKEQFQAAIFEPMLTRSKLKEVIQKGQMPPPFSRSPLKTVSPKTFLDMNFSEEEDDEEYQPSKEELEHVSDDESVHSVHASDFGSPSVSSELMKSRKPSSASGSDNTPTGTPMGPPAAPPLRLQLASDMVHAEQIDKDSNIALRTRSKLPLNDTPLIEIEASLVEPDCIPDLYDTECDEEDWTQFLFDLNRDFPLNDNLDDDLNDPEFDFLNEEENVEDDPEESRNDRAVQIPKKEVKELFSEILDEHEEYVPISALLEDLDEFPPSSVEGSDAFVSEDSFPCAQNTPMAVDDRNPQIQDTAVVAVTDANNSSNVVLSEAQLEAGNLNSLDLSRYPGHMPAFRMNPPLVDAFMSELIKLKNSDDTENDIPRVTKNAKPGNQLIFNNIELNQLKDQMRKHVQLLAQSYVQSWPQFDCSELTNLTDFSKETLVQLKELARSSVVPYNQSYFYTPNLEEAIDVTNRSYESRNKDISKILQRSMTEKVMCQRMYEIRGLTYEQMEVFLTSRAFIFPQMLPEYRMDLIEEGEKKVRVMFSEAEDNLLAMGMDQFSHLPNKYSLIRQYLLPTKTNNQLMFRYKNLRSKKRDMNAVKFLAVHKRLPDFQRYFDVEDEGSILASKDRDPDLLPKWFVAFKDAVQLYTKHQNLKPWTLCGVPGSFLSEHGNRFNMSSLTQRTKSCEILPQIQTPSVMQIVATLGSQPLALVDSSAILGSQPVIIANPSMYLANPSVTCGEQPLIIANPNASFGGQSVTLPVSSATVSNSSVTSSFAYSNNGSESVYKMVEALYPMSSLEAVANPAMQVANQKWPGMQLMTLESTVTNSFTRLDNQATLAATQAANPIIHVVSQMNSSSVQQVANWATDFINHAHQVSDPANTQAEYALDANTVGPFTLSASGGLSAALTVNTEGFRGGWDAQSAAPTECVSGFTSNPGSVVYSQPYVLHTTTEQSFGDSSFSLFSELHSVPLSCSSHVAPRATPSYVSVTAGSSCVVDLPPSFSSGCFSNPTLLNPEIPVSSTGLNHEISDCGAVAPSDATIRDSWTEKIASNTAVTAVVLSTANGSHCQGFQGHSSVVLSPTKVLSKLPDTPEPVLILTKEQLNLLGISVNVLSLPTVSTSKVMPNSQPTNRSVHEVQQEPVVEEDAVQSSAASRLQPPEVDDENSLLHVNTKDFLNYAFAKAMGIPMSELEKSQEDDESRLSAETPNLETSEEQTGSEISCSQNTESEQMSTVENQSSAETQVLRVTEQPLVNPVERCFQGNETDDEIKYSVLSEDNRDIHENQTDPATIATHRMQTSTVESSQGEVATNPVSVKQCEIVASSETNRDQDESSVIYKSNFEFGGFGDMIRNNCSLSPRPRILTEPDENATLCTPKKYFVLSPCAEANSADTDLRIQSPDQSGFKTPRTSASLLSNTPTRSPLWHSPPVRSSTSSLRSMRRPLGHISPIKFPDPPLSSSADNTSLFAVKPSMRKRDRLGKRSVQPIAPRTFGVNSSPLKSTIGSLRVRNKRKKTEISSRMQQILPKPGGTRVDRLQNGEVYSTPPSGKRLKKLEKTAPGSEKSEVESSSSAGIGCEEMETEGDEAPSTAGGCDLDSQTEEENDEELHLAELLEASTTIRVPTRGSRSHAGHKAEQKKELALAMLDPDLVANDRMRDERDAMFARAYHCKVRKTLENDLALYEKYLQLFTEFDQKCKTVKELYGEIKSLLSSYPELVSDFAGFLSPEQALECQCLMTNYKINRARTFMCKLEIYFHKHPPQLQKCLKALKEWLDGSFSNNELYNTVLPHIRSNQHLVEEFSTFFEEKKPPQSHLSKYEEVVLGESDDEMQDYDDYEKVDLSSQENNYATPNCPCRCHVTGAELFLKKLRHCTSCGLKVIKGQLYLQTSDKLLRPATVTIHHQNTDKEEMPDQSTCHKVAKKFKTSKTTSLKQKKSTSKKVSISSCKVRSPQEGTTVMEPDSTSMISPLNSDLAENCSVSVETGDLSKSDDLTPEIDLVSSCHETPIAPVVSQDGSTTRRTVSSSSCSNDSTQFTSDTSECPPHGTDYETHTETPLSNAGTVTSIVVMNSKGSGSALNQLDLISCVEDNTTTISDVAGENVQHFDGDSSRTGATAIAENTYKCTEQAIDKDDGMLTEVKQDSLAVNISLEKNNEKNSIDSLADQRSCSSEGFGFASQAQVVSSPDAETIKDTDQVRQGSVCHQFDVTREINYSLSLSDKESECQDESRTAGRSSIAHRSSVDWTRDEDRVLLKTCQELGPGTDAYQIIVETLTHRTVEQVSDRFDFLMNMYAELNELSDSSATEDEDSDIEDL